MLVLQQIRQQVQVRQELLVNGVVGGVLFCASDVLAQRLEQSEPQSIGKRKRDDETVSPMQQLRTIDREFLRSVDWKRSSSAGILGACLSCGLYPAAYGAIDKIWKRKDFVSLVQKSVVEVFTVGVVANSLSMLVRGLAPARSTSSNHSPLQVFTHMKAELPKVTIDDFKLWFPYNMAAFTFIPTPIRPLTTMLMETIWQTYMSLHSNNYEHHQT
ncbi:unnamed protein product [Cylindrotheca closterium]|uniref:Uncharacterized protein n=1 Tax=Cylindrotheca closterium TaxID=2856 RepID=A0AAD2G175_9STRA|nr:unnamed protein product [Cylindrotheca closterium]